MRIRRALFATLLALALLGSAAGASAEAAAPPTAPPARTAIVHAQGTIVPIPASIPHEAGDMVDSRILPDLRWIAARWPIYITDGYSGPLPNGEHVGCDRCHATGSDHYNGLAVDIVPQTDTPACDANWLPITALALWAEPLPNAPVLPFRWVGYDGDAGHGCGNHLHLSWNHAPAPEYTLAEWVEVFPVGPLPSGPAPRRKRVPSPPLPKGGISLATTGGISTHGYD